MLSDAKAVPASARDRNKKPKDSFLMSTPGPLAAPGVREETPCSLPQRGREPITTVPARALFLERAAKALAAAMKTRGYTPAAARG